MFFSTVKAAVLNLRHPFLPHAMQVAAICLGVTCFLCPSTYHATCKQHACMVAISQRIIRQEDNLN